MKIKLPALVAALLTVTSAFVYAQTGSKISGKILDADGKPIDGATVYLSRSADSALVKTGFADVNGAYLLQGLKKGDYRLSVVMMGFSTYKSDVIKLDLQDVIVPVISLQQKGNALKEVSVVSTKPLVEHLIDRTVMNVDALVSNAGSTAMDVLEKSPGVIVDQNGSISLNGKSSVRIFIDDKPTYLSGSDLESYLRSLPSSTLERIELMTNPPAKYDAAGSGGVINIKTKRSKVKGFNGSVNLAYIQGKYARTNNSVNFNYRNNKLNIFGNLGYGTNNSVNDLDINRQFLNAAGNVTSNFLQRDFIRRKAQNYEARLGVDYYASDKTTLGIGFTGLINPSQKPTLNTSRFLNAQNVLDSTIIADNSDKQNFKNGGVNLNYRHQYPTQGQELTVDLDYLNYQTNSDQSFANTSYLPNGNITHNDLLTGNLPAHINIYSAKTDYSQPLKNGVKLDGGLKTSYTETDNVANYFYTLNNVTLPDYSKTNHFIYKENISAAYINASKSFKRFSIQAGLRVENTITNGHQLGNVQRPDSVFKSNYTGLFPTLYLQYKLDTAGKQQLSLNYSRRIDRPYYQDLNPFLSPLDKFTYYTGNPFLKPSYLHNVELSYMFKNITTSLAYAKTLDDVNETIEIVNGIYYSRPGNLGSVEYKTITIDAGFDPAKWLNIHVYTFAQNIHTVSSFYTGELNTQGTFYFFRPILQFKPGKDWTLQTDASYQSDLTSAQFNIGSRKRVNAAISKKLSGSTTVKLVVNDVFNTFVNIGQINNLANTLANWTNKPDSRTVVISLSYRFGKTISDQRKHNANGAESEQNRVKN
ncbi:MAG: TonB-dependent receptor [Mucilaginibacter sp.]|uniref:TonB-dependent receptor domain-containing protein n=1 Tax=Mucilaginibacter sp. TaxID=1882438 RepID=UPI0032646EB8